MGLGDNVAIWLIADERLRRVRHLATPGKHQLNDDAERNRTALFITYDGLTDPLGRSQILPYLIGLSARGHRITILSCDKADKLKADGAAVKAICDAAGIAWCALPYHRKPPILGPAYNLLALRRAAMALHRQSRFDLVHCRGYIPAIVGLSLKRRFGPKLLFDMRGFWAEERTEGGSWDQRKPVFRAVYGFFKRREAELLGEADQVISLTRNAKLEMETRPVLAGRTDAISVIPCCVDFEHFPLASAELRSQARERLGIAQDRHVLAYLGSLGGNYMLGEMLDFFTAYRARFSDALFLFITRDEPSMIEAAAAEKGLGAADILVRPASRAEVPVFLSAADAGIAFKQPNFSAKACSPTKLGEMLAVGIPVIANKGVGDVEEILDDVGPGLTVERFDREALTQAVERLGRIGISSKEIRAKALKWFDLEEGVARYDRIYRSSAAAAEGRR